MSDQRAREVRADFRRVNAASDQHDCRAALDQLCCFAVARGERAKFARIGKLILDLSELLQPREISGRADGGHDKWLIHRRLSQRLEPEPVAGGVEPLKIVDYLIPGRELAVFARRESKDFLRRWNLCLGNRQGRSTHQKQQRNEYSNTHERQFIQMPAKMHKKPKQRSNVVVFVTLCGLARVYAARVK